MSGGTFSISRQIWGHPAFKREAFTEREAWIWMCGRASWKQRVDRVGEIVVPLDRGQLALSTRFAAKAWGWTDSKVRRFFTRLQKLEMISLKTDAGLTVVNICNYDEYQLGGAVSDADPTQRRRRPDAKKKKDNQGETMREPLVVDADASAQQRATRLPETWTLPPEWERWAVNEGWADKVVRTEAEKFRDYWIGKAGKDAAKLDWKATWRNWMRNSRTPKVINGGSNGRTASKSETRISAFVGGASGAG